MGKVILDPTILHTAGYVKGSVQNVFFVEAMVELRPRQKEAPLLEHLGQEKIQPKRSDKLALLMI